MKRSPRRVAAAIAGAALVQTACIPILPVRSGTDLGEDVAEHVKTTAPTRSDLLRQLGPPAAIFSRGGVQPLPAMPDWGRGHPGSRFAISRDGDAAFELFRDGTEAGADDLVYYWYDSRSSGSTWYLLLVILESTDTSVEQLWALVDPRTDEVRRVVYLPSR